MKKLQLQPFYANSGKKSARAAAKEINNVEIPGTVNKYVAQNLFKCFKDTSLENKPRSGRLFIIEDEALLEMIEQQLSTLFIELGPSKITIKWHLYNLGLANKC